MPRILYANQWFLPEQASRGVQLIHGLKDAGHDVEALTGFPNYPTGKLFPGYRLRPCMRETIAGVSVHRVFLIPSHSNSSIGRAANYLSFFVSVLIFLLLRGRKYDLVYVYHPPITVGLAVALAGLLTRRPFVLEVQDLWPESVTASGMSGTSWMSKVLGPLCSFVYRRAAFVFGQSRGMTRRLIERGASPDRSGTLFNWADEDALTPGGRYDLEALRFEGRFNFVFGGNMGRVQGLDTVIRAAVLASREAPEIQVTLIGGGVERENLVRLADGLNATNVRFRPEAPQADISDVFQAADVLLVHLKDDPLFEITIPSKTQFYLAMAKPILIGMRGEAPGIVVDAGAGLATAPDDPRAMADLMVQMARMSRGDLDEMGRRAGDAYARNYSLAAATATVVDAVHSTLARPEQTL